MFYSHNIVSISEARFFFKFLCEWWKTGNFGAKKPLIAAAAAVCACLRPRTLLFIFYDLRISFTTIKIPRFHSFRSTKKGKITFYCYTNYMDPMCWSGMYDFWVHWSVANFARFHNNIQDELKFCFSNILLILSFLFVAAIDLCCKTWFDWYDLFIEKLYVHNEKIISFSVRSLSCAVICLPQSNCYPATEHFTPIYILYNLWSNKEAQQDSFL